MRRAREGGERIERENTGSEPGSGSKGRRPVEGTTLTPTREPPFGAREACRRWDSPDW